MSLQSQLDAFRAGWETRVGKTIARLIAGDIDDLRASGILDRTAKAGDRMPATANLRDAHGQPFDLGRLIEAKPVIVTSRRLVPVLQSRTARLPGAAR